MRIRIFFASLFFRFGASPRFQLQGGTAPAAAFGGMDQKKPGAVKLPAAVIPSRLFFLRVILAVCGNRAERKKQKEDRTNKTGFGEVEFIEKDRHAESPGTNENHLK